MNPLLLIQAVDKFFFVLEIAIIIRVLLSWLPIGRDNFFVKLVYSITDPLLAPIRNLIYKSPLGGSGMVLDFSPIIAYFLMSLLKQVIISILISFV